MSQSAEPTDNEPEATRDGGAVPWTQLLQTLLGATAVLAGTLYAGFHLALVRFYANFGLTPENVGWDLQTTLVAFTVPITVASILMLLGLFAWFRGQERGQRPTRRVIRLVMILGYFSLIYALVIPLSIAGEQAKGIKTGEETLWVYRIFFPVSAPCVTAFWKTPKEVDINAPFVDQAIGNDQQLVLLGSHDASTIVFDAASGATIRLSASDLVLVSCA